MILKLLTSFNAFEVLSFCDMHIEHLRAMYSYAETVHSPYFELLYTNTCSSIEQCLSCTGGLGVRPTFFEIIRKEKFL